MLLEIEQQPGQRNLPHKNCTFSTVIITEQKMANPCILFSPFQTVLFSSVVIQLEVTKR
jgi:hypothetical protein